MVDKYTNGCNRFYGKRTAGFTAGKSVTSDLPLKGKREFLNCTVSLEAQPNKNLKPHAVVRDPEGKVILDVGARSSSLYPELKDLAGETIASLQWKREVGYSDDPYFSVTIQEQMSSANHLKTIPQVFLDTETTGLNPYEDEILQVGMIDGDGNVLFSRKFKPQHVKAWSEAQRIHRITKHDVANCGPIEDSLAEMQQILDSAEAIYAFNAPFDFGFLGMIGLHAEEHRTHDTMRLYAKKFHNRQYIKLTVAAQESGYYYKPHDALADCLATLQVQRRVDGLESLRLKHPISPTMQHSKATLVAGAMKAEEAIGNSAHLSGLQKYMFQLHKGAPHRALAVWTLCLGIFAILGILASFGDASTVPGTLFAIIVFLVLFAVLHFKLKRDAAFEDPESPEEALE
ncbi:DNA polymerase III subunit epsilon [Bifidobacterium dolichotidis]|uniref:DNA polymerase III subunit epsilon n=1 Tax=Bifidobacterium dolichotidis TaxID=2306976 RepID=A0A430FPN4_9BIFI|nr:3'-5' exonuclease [Bifidobacterium dolichotidis]RSX54797.1 DNA polymerase III subunit epsilon [Bifidobacterium dolichotidis]